MKTDFTTRNKISQFLSFFSPGKSLANFLREKQPNPLRARRNTRNRRKTNENVRKILSFLFVRATINLFNLIIRCYAFSIERSEWRGKSFAVFLFANFELRRLSWLEKGGRISCGKLAESCIEGVFVLVAVLEGEI